MAKSTRRLALSKRVSLAHLFENNDQCYAMVRPATRAEYKEMMGDKLSKLDAAKQADVQTSFVRDHFVSGKLLILGENDKPELVDMTADDIDLFMTISNALYIGIMGLNLDPKDL